MSLEQKQVRNALVFYDNTKSAPERWYDAIGPGVIKWNKSSGSSTDDTTGDPTEWTVTVTEAGAGGDSTIVNSATAGEQFLITTDNAEYDGVNAQVKGEAIKLDSNNPLYFRADIKINDADQTDMLFGIAQTDTTLMATGTAHAVSAAEGVFFYSLDGATTINFASWTSSAESNVAVSGVALADSTYVTLEMYWDGATISGYVNQTLVGSFTASLPTTDMTLSLNFRTGETTANTCNVKEMKVIQVRSA